MSTDTSSTEDLAPKHNPLPWSYSKISCFKSCKRKYFFRYILKLPSAPSKAMARGNEIHKACENFVDGLISEEAFATTLLNYEIKPNSYFADFVRKLRAAKESGTDITTETRIPFTKDFEVFKKEPGQEQFGIAILDVISRADSGDRVFDYKTGKVYADDHEFQALLYALVVYRISGKIPEVYFLYADSDEQKRYPGANRNFTEQNMVDAEFLLNFILEEMSKEIDFDPTESFRCRFCDYIERCGK